MGTRRRLTAADYGADAELIGVAHLLLNRVRDRHPAYKSEFSMVDRLATDVRLALLEKARPEATEARREPTGGAADAPFATANQGSSGD